MKKKSGSDSNAGKAGKSRTRNKAGKDFSVDVLPAWESETDAPSGTGEPDDSANSRIAEAGLRVLAEARRLFTTETGRTSSERVETVSRKPAREMEAMPAQAERSHLIEITDDEDHPLLCMTPESAIRQNLRHRLVAVAMRTRKNKLILHKGRDGRLGFSRCWDLHTGFVFAGEAREEAGLRLLQDAGLSGLRLQYLGAWPDDRGRAHCTFFGAELPSGLYPMPVSGPETPEKSEPAFTAEKKEDLLELDADELHGLVERASELFSPELLLAAGKNILFKKKG